MNAWIATLGLFVSLAVGLGNAASAADRPAKAKNVDRDAKGIEFFEQRIRPVLVERCYECHSAGSKMVKGGLVLDTRAGIRAGGDSGHAVVPGSVDDSLLISAIKYESYEMPPDGMLEDDVIADFVKWVEMGSPDPRGGAGVVASEPAVAQPKDLWSLRPVKDHAIEPLIDAAWPWTDIDRLVAARREARGLAPVADAEPLALLRRVCFDLVGLPPTPSHIDSFVRDSSRQNFERIVDRLLASPQFGERWGRHWLDVARYAESAGKDRDVLYPHAWRYRNYVIDAFAADKPYDEFIREQVAGDLLPARDQAEHDAHLVATGLLAIGPKSNGRSLQMDLVDDQIDVVGRAVLGLTVSCARCHDHKFDPIPTKDYYALAGIFLSTEALYGGGQRNAGPGKGSENLLQPLGDDSEQRAAEYAEFEKELAAVQKKLNAARNRQRNLQQANAKIRADGKTPTRDQIRARKAAETEAARLETETDELNNRGPAPIAYCMAVRERNKPADTKVLVRGEIGKFGDEAPRGFLSSVATETSHAVDPTQSGRLQLADWLADPSNPLPARVAVNRVWHHLFGRGIVRTTDNFGANGEMPTHPELLDYLARRFVEEGWSTKRIVREIVLSRTYQLASDFDAAAYEVDPDNALLWRASTRRLDVESIRDAMLAASGKLDLDRPVASPIAEIGPGEVGRGIDEDPIERPFYHRSVYLPILRTKLLEILRVFDFPEPSIVVGTRDVTTVPSQALFMMNSPLVIEQAQGLAARILEPSGLGDADRVNLAYKLALGRPATIDEQARSIEFVLRAQSQLAQASPQADEPALLAWTGLCQALLATAEFRYIQ